MMTRRQMLASLAAAAVPKPRPNFLFLLTDDQRFNTLRALGNDEVQTPNMDSLVRRGVTFTHACTQGGTVPAICLPSRGQIMTGQTLFHVHDSLIDQQSARPTTTFPEVLRSQGYATFATGKWHNGKQLFHRSFSTGGSIFFGGMADHSKMPVFDFDPSGKYPADAQRTAKEFSSVAFANETVRFLGEVKRDEPFLAYCAFTAPHDPRMAPKQYTDLYPPDRVRMPKNFLPEHPFDNGEMRIRDEMLAPFPRTPQIVREHIAAYYAMITEVDTEIGRILKALAQSGAADNTYIVFAADNGLAVGQHGLLGKQNLYDHSLRVPLVIAGPGVPHGKQAHGLCHLMDLCPTILDLAGAPRPASVESLSLTPAIQNPAVALRQKVVFGYRNVQRGIRTDRWKLIAYNVGGKKTLQLFDLHHDPLEMRNLATEANQQSRVRDLCDLLKQELKAEGDRQDLEARDWTAYR